MKKTRVLYLSLLLLLCIIQGLHAGSNPDETKVTRIIYVNQSSTSSREDGTLNAPFKTLAKAIGDWDGTTHTKISIFPGTYREQLLVTGGDQPNNTVLVIEGKEPGKVIISGSDPFVPSEWTSLGNGLYSHDWQYDFGNYDGDQGSENPKGLLGHRREMVFINGKRLTPMILEDYKYTPKPKGDYGGQGSWEFKSYLGTGVLTPGTFGVAERDENKIYIKLADSIDFNSAKIEVAVRENTLIARKNNLVVRNLVFQHAATKFGDGGSVIFGDRWMGYLLSYHMKNILLENVDIHDNSSDGLMLIGTINMNLKKVKSNYNGGNGMVCAYTQQGKWEDTETSYNCWRSEGLGGGYEWSAAGMKVAWCSKNMTYIRHTAIGNPSIGFWFDGNNYGNTMEGFVIKKNKSGMLFEISEGPLTITNSEVTDNIGEGICTFESGQVFIKNCTVANNIGTQIKLAGTNGGRNRTVPEEYQGPLYSVPQKTGTVSIVNNKIYTNKGKNSYLLTPEYLVWASEEPTYGNFLKTQLWADSNLYYNPDNTNVFGINIDNSIKDGFRLSFSAWRTYLKDNSTFSNNTRETHSRWAKELITTSILAGNSSIHKNMTVYPNPAQEQLNILLTDKEDDGVYSLSIQDLSGRLVLEQEGFSAFSTQSIALNVKNLENGLYILKLEGRDNSNVLFRAFSIGR